MTHASQEVKDCPGAEAQLGPPHRSVQTEPAAGGGHQALLSGMNDREMPWCLWKIGRSWVTRISPSFTAPIPGCKAGRQHSNLAR